jgi:hypothetical protein
LPEDELLKVLPQIVGKSVTYNHNRRFVLGHYIDYKYIQATKTIIAYAVFYKSNFAPEWKRAQELYRANKLSTSFEIWAPLTARKNRADGTVELRHIEITGGSLIFTDDGANPASEDAVVLEMASQKESDLVFASKYKEEELIRASLSSENIMEVNQEIPVSRANKVTCSNCKEEFETEVVTGIECPKCFSILKNDGTVLYPPQIQNFNISCPNCDSKNWLIKSNSDDNAEIKCQGCSKEYIISFAKTTLSEGLSKMSNRVLYSATANCIQCDNSISIAGISSQKIFNIDCPKCHIKFKLNVADINKNKKICSIEEKIEDERSEHEMEAEKDMAVLPKEELVVAKKAIHLGKKLDASLESGKQLTYEERQNLNDADFAVVKTIKNEKTNKEKTVRMFPVHDKAHVRNALARLPQATETLNKLGINPDSVKAKILKRARTLKMTDLLDNYKMVKALCGSVKKLKKANSRLVGKILASKRESRLVTASLNSEILKSKNEEIEKITKEYEEKIESLKSNSQLVIARRMLLGDYSKDISDKDILDDVIFEKINLQKENANLRAAKANEGNDDIAGLKAKEDELITAMAKKITEMAFGLKK